MLTNLSGTWGRYNGVRSFTFSHCSRRSGEDSGEAILSPAALDSCLEAIAGRDAVKEPELVLVSTVAIVTTVSATPSCSAQRSCWFCMPCSEVSNGPVKWCTAASLNPVQVFGEVLTLASFPPWLLRFSEIFHAGHLAAFSRGKLHRILWRYCRTSQRFGR